MTHIRPLRSFRVVFANVFVQATPTGTLKRIKHTTVQLKASSADRAAPAAAWVTGLPEHRIAFVREVRPTPSPALETTV